MTIRAMVLTLVFIGLVVTGYTLRVRAVDRQYAVEHAGHEKLHAELQVGIEGAERGDFIDCGDDDLPYIVALGNPDELRLMLNPNGSTIPSTPRELAQQDCVVVKIGTMLHYELLMRWAGIR